MKIDLPQNLDLKQKLEILAKWMKNYHAYNSDMYTGALESAVARGREQTIQYIGNLLEEILTMDDEQIKNELENKI
jgi:hypothetical protein